MNVKRTLSAGVFTAVLAVSGIAGAHAQDDTDFDVYFNIDELEHVIEAFTIARLTFEREARLIDGQLSGNRIFYFASGRDFIVDEVIQTRALNGFSDGAASIFTAAPTGHNACVVGRYRFADADEVIIVVHSTYTGLATSLDCLVAGIWYVQRGSLEEYRSDYWEVLLRELLETWTKM
jgi:hypothetical protein